MKRYFVLVVGLLLNLNAFGQEDLSLSQAIQIGLSRNYDIKIESKWVDIATNNNQWGEAGRYPRIDMGLNQNNTVTSIDNPASFVGGDIINNTLNPTISLNWTLFSGYKISTTKRRLEKLQEESEGNASIVISNTIQSIILGYYLVVLEEERLKVFQENLELSRDKYNLLKIRRDFGGAVTSDLLLEEGNYLTDSTNYINQQLFHRNALRNFNVLLAEQNPNKDYNFTDPLEIEIEEYDLVTLLDRMEKDNVDLSKLYLSQSILAYDTRIRKADRWPVVTFGTGYNHNRNRQDLSNAVFAGSGFEAPQDPINSTQTTYFGNFGLTFNLFNGNRINRAIQNAMIQEDIGNLNIDRIKTSLYRDASAALDRYNSSGQLYAIDQRNREVALLNQQINGEKYRNGTINSFDYRTVQNRLLLAVLNELASMATLIEAKIDLMRLTGGILEEYHPSN